MLSAGSNADSDPALRQAAFWTDRIRLNEIKRELKA
jgi:hypothetical protein